MGIGDQIMALGRAKEIYDSPGFNGQVAIGDGQRVLHNDLYRGNPRIVKINDRMVGNVKWVIDLQATDPTLIRKRPCLTLIIGGVTERT